MQNYAARLCKAILYVYSVSNILNIRFLFLWNKIFDQIKKYVCYEKFKKYLLTPPLVITTSCPFNTFSKRSLYFTRLYSCMREKNIYTAKWYFTHSQLYVYVTICRNSIIGLKRYYELLNQMMIAMFQMTFLCFINATFVI